ncbi:MAG: HD domain-containing protein [Acidobacteriia bacterium]|nr:HD domain-containing protein [Terriglobia bacterium]
MKAPESDIARRLEVEQAQLNLYARDLKRLFLSERDKSAQLRAANRQLQAYARDFRTAFYAERQKARELEKAYHDTVLRLVKAMRYKDDETGAHIVRLSHFAKFLAQQRGWKAAAAQLLFDATPMHDVGKIAVPDAILQKAGPLTPEEWEVVRRHPMIGASLLQGSASPLLELARGIALCHHERWDGTGYPRRLRGERIPQSARIVMLVDQYDALRTRRPYKPGLAHAQTVDILLKGDGRTLPQHFDPEVLELFSQHHAQLEVIYERFRD